MRSNGFSRTGYTFTGWNTAANGSGTSYAAGASYKAAANLTLYAQWKLDGYTLKWTGRLSQYGSYLGSGNVTGRSGNAGYKRIVYTNTSGQTAYADPYSAGSITIKPGTTVALQMVAGRNDYIQSYIRWYVGGSYVDNNFGYVYALLSSSWMPSGSYTLTTRDDIYYSDDIYYWGVQAS